MFNFGALLKELGRPGEVERSFRRAEALGHDPAAEVLRRYFGDSPAKHPLKRVASPSASSWIGSITSRTCHAEGAVASLPGPGCKGPIRPNPAHPTGVFVSRETATFEGCVDAVIFADERSFESVRHGSEFGVARDDCPPQKAADDGCATHRLVDGETEMRRPGALTDRYLADREESDVTRLPWCATNNSSLSVAVEIAFAATVIKLSYPIEPLENRERRDAPTTVRSRTTVAPPGAGNVGLPRTALCVCVGLRAS